MYSSPPKSTLFPYTTLFRSGQLQQRSPTGAEKQGRLAMDPPADGKRSEDAGLRIGGSISNGVPETTHLDWRDGLGVNVHISDRKSTRLNSSHTVISYAVFCL